MKLNLQKKVLDKIKYCAVRTYIKICSITFHPDEVQKSLLLVMMIYADVSSMRTIFNSFMYLYSFM